MGASGSGNAHQLAACAVRPKRSGCPGVMFDDVETMHPL
jgi:hypothetical protein